MLIEADRAMLLVSDLQARLVPARMVTVVVGDRGAVEPELRKLNLGAIEYRDADGRLLKK